MRRVVVTCLMPNEDDGALESDDELISMFYRDANVRGAIDIVVEVDDADDD